MAAACEAARVQLPKPAWLLRQTPAAVVAEIDRLLEDHTDGEIAHLLNEQGLTSGNGQVFHSQMVRRLRIDYGLRSRYDRLRKLGLITLDELAMRLDVCRDTIKRWRRAALIPAQKCDDRGEFLFELPGPNTPVKHQHQGKTTRKSTTFEGSSLATTA